MAHGRNGAPTKRETRRHFLCVWRRRGESIQMVKPLAVWLSCLILIASGGIVSAWPDSYALHWKKNDGQTVVQVYNRRTGQKAWKRSFSDVGFFTWSSDRRSLAFVSSVGPKGSALSPIEVFTIGTWRAGASVHLQPPQRFRGCDYVEFLVWSPDGKRLLVATGGSGEADIGAADLTCLDLETGAAHRFIDMASVRDGNPRWLGSHRIVYRLMIHPEDEHHHSYLWGAKKQHFFECP